MGLAYIDTKRLRLFTGFSFFLLGSGSARSKPQEQPDRVIATRLGSVEDRLNSLYLTDLTRVLGFKLETP
jgi:hypothetical protein